MNCKRMMDRDTDGAVPMRFSVVMVMNRNEKTYEDHQDN